MLADTRLVADRAAIVTARHAEAGQVVGPAQVVVELADVAAREAVFIAPAELDLAMLAGHRITLRTVEPPERQAQAVISHVAPMIDNATGGVAIRARIEAGDGAGFMLGESVTAALVQPLGRVARVPAAALVGDGAAPAVWLVGDDGSVSLRPVSVAHYGTPDVYLSSGLSGGERVVTRGANLLYPGRHVAVLAADGETKTGEPAP